MISELWREVTTSPLWQQHLSPEETLYFGKLLLSVGVGLLPIIGDYYDAISAAVGYDLITGQKLAWWEKALALAPLASVATWKLASFLGDVGRASGRLDELGDVARHSSGLLPNPGRAWRLKWLTDFLLTSFRHQKALDQQIEELVEQRDDYGLIVNVPYAGPPTLGVIVAVTGDVGRFSNYRKYVAYTGYFPGLEESQTIDRTKMSRRGNRDLKRALFQIAAPLVWFDEGSNPYKELFQRKMAEGREWYQAMPFVCAALARHIYHCLKFNDPYDVEKVFGGSSFTPALDEESLDLAAHLDDTFEVMEASLDEIEG